ncbi:hypothetical protein [Flexistipes sp.]|uniref:hypothetical protein n=1 Tax=Flexistipes sp. TaxID=3088135 RepID=UPI002E2272F1|nr:hypothetical protein [Flexistipes sp.]
MSLKWCENCQQYTDVEKVTQTPGIFLVIAMVIFFMPVIGTFVGIPSLIITFLWWLNTPVKCTKCGSRNIKKIKEHEKPSENVLIARKYEEKINNHNNDPN